MIRSVVLADDYRIWRFFGNYVQASARSEVGSIIHRTSKCCIPSLIWLGLVVAWSDVFAQSFPHILLSHSFTHLEGIAVQFWLLKHLSVLLSTVLLLIYCFIFSQSAEMKTFIRLGSSTGGLIALLGTFLAVVLLLVSERGSNGNPSSSPPLILRFQQSTFFQERSLDNNISARAFDGTCSIDVPCINGACCSSSGFCGYGKLWDLYASKILYTNSVVAPEFCGETCLSNCDATAECGEYADPPNTECPLNVWYVIFSSYKYNCFG